MSPYRLRQSPMPSKRMLEAGEVSMELVRIGKKRRTKLREEAKPSEVAKELESGLTTVESSDSKPDRPKPINDVLDQTPTSRPLKRKRTANTKTAKAAPAKRRKIDSNKPIATKKSQIAGKGDRSKKSETEPEEITLPQDSHETQLPTSGTFSPSIAKAHLALDASIRALLDGEIPPPTPLSQARKGKSKDENPVDVPLLHPSDTTCGLQVTPRRALETATLSSPETSPTPFPPSSEESSAKEHAHIIQSRPVHRLTVPNLPSRDIVSGVKPPALSETEEKIWNTNLGETWQQEELPDQYGRLWRCVKMVGKDFQEDIGWDRGGTNGASGDDISPGSPAEDFAREVELFLSAFGEELPAWEVLKEVEKMDFGDD